MNNEIQQFYFNGAALRTLTDKTGEPWFVAKDVCDILELNNITEALRPLDDDEKTNFRNSEVAQNGGRAPIIISEPGLYKLIMRSRKPEAKEFQRWVTHSDGHVTISRTPKVTGKGQRYFIARYCPKKPND